MGQHIRKIWYVFVRVTRTQSEASAENICNCVSVAWSSATQFDIVTSCGQFSCCSLRGWRSYAKLLGVTYLNAANRLQFSREETFWGYMKCAMRNELNSAFFLSEFFVHACWLLKELNFREVLQKWSESQSAAVDMKGLHIPVIMQVIMIWKGETKRNDFRIFSTLNVT